MAIPQQHRFNALAVDTDMDARMRLKQAAQSVHQFKQIKLISSVMEAENTVRDSEAASIDVIFLSERLPKEDVHSFITQAKEEKKTRDCAFVLLLVATEEENTKAAQSVLEGFDGCLMEPYSVDSLVEITELAAEVKKERQETRENAAIKFLVKDIAKMLDRLSFLKSCEMDVGTSLKRLRHACQTFETFDERSRQFYYDTVCEIFQKAPPEGYVGNRATYKGVSERVKKRMAQKIIEEEKREAAKQGLV